MLFQNKMHSDMNALSLHFLSIMKQCQKSKNIVETARREGKGRHADTMILEVNSTKASTKSINSGFRTNKNAILIQNFT
jgi:hypothetical protein